VALVEKFDFSSGTSSRSTKLIHGGVRYLEKAVFGFDIEQYRMVKEALAERGNLCQIAPHLAHPLPIMLPVYKYLNCVVAHGSKRNTFTDFMPSALLIIIIMINKA